MALGMSTSVSVAKRVVPTRQVAAPATAICSVLPCGIEGATNPKIRVSNSPLVDKKAIEISFMTSS
jgi:hypothetical protein